MTNEEAIIHFKEQLEIFGGEHHEAMKVAISALEKQIPKFVRCPKGWQGIRDTRYYCPSCNSLTRRHEAICHKCGQAVKYPKDIYCKETNRIILDWSE